jgi:GNAT superfamily N-acetyltransferase
MKLIFVLEEWQREIIYGIMDLAAEFIRESEYGVSFNPQKVYDRLHQAFFDPDGDIIVAIDTDGNVVGGAVVYAYADWQDEKFGYLEKFYLHPRTRGSGIGRMIAKKCAVWFDDHDCLYSFATSTANIGSTGHFCNMMAKFGYKSVGPTLSRKKNHGKI